MEKNPLDMMNEIVISTVDMGRSISNIFDIILDATIIVLSTEIISQIAKNQAPIVADLPSFQAFSYLVSQLCQLTFLQLNSIDASQDDPHSQYLLNLKNKLGDLLQKKEGIILH